MTVGIYEYAKVTGHSVKHIYEQIRLGKIRAKKNERGVWKINRSILNAALTQRAK